MHATAVRRYAPRKGESRDPSANIVIHKDLTAYPVRIFVLSEPCEPKHPSANLIISFNLTSY